MAEIYPPAANRIDQNSPPRPKTPAATSDAASDFWGEGGFSFDDILDLINPLQHVPVIGTIYRALTGDQISTGSSFFGGALFGGIAGAAFAVVNAVIEEVTGKKAGEHIVAMLGAEAAPSLDDAPIPTLSADIGSRAAFNPAAAVPDPIWLTAIPRAKASFATAAMRSMTPAMGLQLVPTVAEDSEKHPTRDAVKHYSRQAMATKIKATRPNFLDLLN